jgi:hypothetical protein
MFAVVGARGRARYLRAHKCSTTIKHMYAVCELRLLGGSESGSGSGSEQPSAASLRSHPVAATDRWCEDNLQGNKVVSQAEDLCYWPHVSRIIAVVCAVGAVVVMCVLASMR